ncbi:hypothetical protein FANTH_6680 [Fusarium anthophilum]|uniref:Glucose-methanol-choline oxidoreductase N-terminal domain-containing protein n=1 Tax=Fusarium anthophilum TaxID=48485 RepID=A0A8H4ZI17_9HYPO|nr:hypothetical protein FANTH_6680 [Fusarium anthophilum]
MLFGNLLLPFLALFLPLAESLHVTPDIADGQLRNVYDYIIVGGGTADSKNLTNGVLSFGPDSRSWDDARNLSIPGGLLPVPGTIGSGGWQKYQWGLTTEPQTYLNNQNVGIPQGKAVGGSSILNGLCWSRGSVSDYDGWEKLGNKGWSWNDLLPYFKKELHIRPQSDAHEYNGSVHVSYPQYFYDQSSNVLDGFAELGLPIIGDVNNRTAAGAMILPSSMYPDNQTRFDAREAHFNSASSSNSPHNSSQRVMGAEVSGIGPSDVLKSLNISVKIDLPGVGYNLQDHPMAYANYYYRNESYFRSDEITDDMYDKVAEEYIQNRTGPWTAPLINTVAFPSLRSATGDWKQFMNKSSGDGIPSHIPKSVKKGYEVQKKILQDQILSNDTGIFETMANS